MSVKWCGQTSPVTRTPRCLAAADQLDAAGSGDVQDVQPAAGELGQGDVAVDHDFLGRGRHAAQAQPHALEAFVHDAAAGQVEVLGSG